MIIPAIDAAAICTAGTRQTITANKTTTNQQIGIARRAGHRRPTSNNATTKIGNIANTASAELFIQSNTYAESRF